LSNGFAEGSAVRVLGDRKSRCLGEPRGGYRGGETAGDPRRTTMTPDPRREQEEVDAAAAEAARIGGVAGDEDLDPAQRPVVEGGGGEAEGFELAEQALIEHASHGDQQSAHAVVHDRGVPEERGTAEDGEADHEHSSEGDEDW